MVEKKIRSLADCELKTVFQTHFLSVDEVKVIQFKDQRAFDALLKLGTFVEAGKDEKVEKKIPFVLPEVDEETLVEMPVIEEMHEHILPTQRNICTGFSPANVDPPEGIDPDKPDLPCPKEDENLKFDDEIIIEEVPVEDVIIPGSFGSPEEFIEEVPIEEQDECLPELEPGMSTWQDGGQDDTGGFEVEEI